MSTSRASAYPNATVAQKEGHYETLCKVSLSVRPEIHHLQNFIVRFTPKIGECLYAFGLCDLGVTLCIYYTLAVFFYW